MKPNRQTVKTSGKFVTIGLLIGLLIGAFIAYGQAPTSTFTISSGIYPGAPSYTVWLEGSTYFAKDANGLIAYSGTNATQIVGNAMDVLLTLGDVGGSITIMGSPLPIFFVLGYVANNTRLEGIGEVQINSTNDGVDEFIMREGSIMSNIFLRHDNCGYVVKYLDWTSYYAIMQAWSDFPSNGGLLMFFPGTITYTHMLVDGSINTEGAGEMISPFYRFWYEPNAYNVTFGLRVSVLGELQLYELSTGHVYEVHGQLNVTGAVNSVTIQYQHGWTLAGTTTDIRTVLITPGQSGQGLHWVGAYNTTHITIEFANQPGASTWIFYYQVTTGVPGN